jgi:GrpB-like predicted nucleotidyltransferase (UPF0157 family)
MARSQTVATHGHDRHLAFRDALRADPALADAYGDLKRTLAARLSHDRNAYTEAKSAFIEQVLAGRLPPRRGRAGAADHPRSAVNNG